MTDTSPQTTPEPTTPGAGKDAFAGFPAAEPASPHRDDLVAQAFRRDGDSPSQGFTTGDYDLQERARLGRLPSHSTELDDVIDAEYRQLRLERVVLVGVWTEGTQAEAEAAMAELRQLAETAGSEVVDALIQRRDKPDKATYIGSGKTQELKQIVVATGADTVICDGELSPGQLIALEKAVNVKVVDRTALILDIFAQHAKSREGKAQVSLAQMEYMIPRLRGWGESMSRQAGGRAGSNGGVGLRGPGETKIETDRRRIRTRMAKIRHEIAEMKTARDIKRQARAASVIPQIAIAGYTNAGKSSLLNRLTGAGALVQNALFATLDPTTRRAELADGRHVVLTDTVGFVRHLPTQLVEAFRSTLEEVAGADLVLHVVDGSDPFPLKQISSVNAVINEVVREQKVEQPPELIVINKIDAADPLTLAELAAHLPEAVFVSAATGEGMVELGRRISEFLALAEVEALITVPYARGDIVARLHTDGTVISEDYTAEGTRLHVRIPTQVAQEIRPHVQGMEETAADQH